MPADVVEINLCPRTLCIFRRGERIPNFTHVYHYTGEIPCTGPQVCMFCGKRKEN